MNRFAFNSMEGFGGTDQVKHWLPTVNCLLWLRLRRAMMFCAVHKPLRVLPHHNLQYHWSVQQQVLYSTS